MIGYKELINWSYWDSWIIWWCSKSIKVNLYYRLSPVEHPLYLTCRAPAISENTSGQTEIRNSEKRTEEINELNVKLQFQSRILIENSHEKSIHLPPQSLRPDHLSRRNSRGRLTWSKSGEVPSSIRDIHSSLSPVVQTQHRHHVGSHV